MPSLRWKWTFSVPTFLLPIFRRMFKECEAETYFSGFQWELGNDTRTNLLFLTGPSESYKGASLIYETAKLYLIQYRNLILTIQGLYFNSFNPSVRIQLLLTFLNNFPDLFLAQILKPLFLWSLGSFAQEPTPTATISWYDRRFQGSSICIIETTRKSQKCVCYFTKMAPCPLAFHFQ